MVYGRKISHNPYDILGEHMSLVCPVCGKKEHISCDDDLGEDGLFYSCSEHSGGCGSTFRVTLNGDCVDIF
jgi:phage/plasmid primase-like uncharacterized protein